MARHRVGDRYLSQEEYDAENDWKWGLLLFAIGAIIAGMKVHGWIAPLGWPKWALFTAVTAGGITFGSVLAYLRNIIGMGIFLIIAITVIYYIGVFIWSLI
jgi:hypothetical protein